MSQRLCALEDHEKYFCYMHKLLIEIGNVDDLSYLKYYLRSFPGSVPDAEE